VSAHSEESARELPENADLSHLEGQAAGLVKSGQPQAKAALTTGKTGIRCLRWAAVLALVCSLLGDLVYSALSPDGRAHRPAPLAVVQDLVFLFLFYALRETAVVVAGALLAPRARLATAIVLAALLVPLSLRNHVLSQGGPWWFWRNNYTHFTLEALGAVLGVMFIYWSEKVRASVPSVLPDTPPPE